MTSKNGKRTFWTLMTDITMANDSQTPDFLIGLKIRFSSWCWSRIGNPWYDGYRWTDRSPRDLGR